MRTPFRLVIDNDCWFFYSLIVLAHFRPNNWWISPHTYNTQIAILTCAIISKAHYNDKYKYVQNCGVEGSVLHNQLKFLYCCKNYFREFHLWCRITSRPN
jgi:hypothetical protein